MPEEYSFPKRKISIDNDAQNIVSIIAELLKQNGASTTVIESDTFNKEGILYSLIKQVEDVVGEKFGATLKHLPEMQVDLDPFAYSLVKDFEKYITGLLCLEKIPSREIIAETITNKYVLIREIFLRLFCHALSLKSIRKKEGEVFLKIINELVFALNKKGILSQDNIFGRSRITNFGTSLTYNMDDWIKLMSNAMTGSQLLHQNTHACSQCLTALRRIQYITYCQLAVFIDSNKRSEDYHPSLVETTLETWLSKNKIEGLEKLLKENYKIIIEEGKVNERLWGNIDLFIERNASLKKNKNVLAIKKRIYFLSEINSLIKMVGKLSVHLSFLAWLPIITGVLKLNELSKYLNYLEDKADILLNTKDLKGKEALTEKEIAHLNQNGAWSLGNIILNKDFAGDQLKNLQNKKVISRLLELLGENIESLLTLQQELGIEVIEEKKLAHLYQSLNDDKLALSLGAGHETTPMELKKRENTLITKPSLERQSVASQNGSIQTREDSSPTFFKKGKDVIPEEKRKDKGGINPKRRIRF